MKPRAASTNWTDAGWQACRQVGMGRMSEPEEILEALWRVLAAQRGQERRD